ncbi:MAG: hypothetical protein LUF27_16465 [Lachnospiraceae bacterium]|nr:hypothetical protein [Lachnospiraceae bacterium]
MMNWKEKALFGVNAYFDALFHAGPGQFLGYLHDELEPVGNDISYLPEASELLSFCKTRNSFCRKGMELFAQQKYQAAHRLFGMASAMHCPEADYCRAVCLLSGKGVPRNPDEAFQLVRSSAERSGCCLQLMGRCSGAVLLLR